MHASAVLIEGAKKLSLAEIGLKDPEGWRCGCSGSAILVFRPAQKNCYGRARCRRFLVWHIHWCRGMRLSAKLLIRRLGTGHKVGDFVFVPGSSGFREAKGLIWWQRKLLW